MSNGLIHDSVSPWVNCHSVFYAFYLRNSKYSQSQSWHYSEVNKAVPLGIKFKRMSKISVTEIYNIECNIFKKSKLMQMKSMMNKMLKLSVKTGSVLLIFPFASGSFTAHMALLWNPESHILRTPQAHFTWSLWETSNQCLHCFRHPMQLRDLLVHMYHIIYLSNLLEDFALVKILTVSFNRHSWDIGMHRDTCIDDIPVYPNYTERDFQYRWDL